jgi:outer membrane receptor protein involved in Fe transport
MKLSIVTLITLLFLSTPIFAQLCTVTGTITDATTKETLVGSTVLIQGTTQGTITDFDGNFKLDKLNPGIYNIVVSFVSYDPQIIKVDLKSSNTQIVNVELKSASLDIGEVKVTARRRDNTEVALLSSLKTQNLIVSGISAQQIAKSQDKDAAEVIRRVPGITITNGKFVIVRGLIERYNSVMLNNATAPSFEADKRAFSFDAIPSGLINNILIYKSPAPELPADFAGAAINIETKDVADENSLTLSYSAGFAQHASFNENFATYKGGKTDWLGWDDGTRAIPEGVPTSTEFNQLYNWEDGIDAFLERTEKITATSKLFSNNWGTTSKTPFLDQSFSITSQRRFVLGKVTFGNITALNYGLSHNYINRNRLEYQSLSEATGEMLKDFDFNDVISQQSAKIGLIHNWNILYGNNQKIEIRNFLNQMGTVSTNIRDGVNYYNVETLKLYDLKFVNRLVYSGQLAGEQKFNNDRTKINWMAGLGFTKNDQPDNRRLTYVLDENENGETFGKYFLRVQNVSNAYLAGRIWLDMTERIYNGKLDFEHKFKLFGSEENWIIKAGGFYERKIRKFNSRLLGVVATKSPQFDLTLTARELFVPENFYFDTTPPVNKNNGFSYRDNTRAKDSYNAYDLIQAGYMGLSIPFFSKVVLYAGVRAERFNRLITDFYDPTPTPELYDITRDTLNFFPSANLTYNISEKHLLRASYGKTVNRPEFREMSNFDYQDFDMFVLLHGNDSLKNAYINNFDVRYEWYPSAGEIISVAAFYKDFSNPIEVFLIPAGTGYDYKPFNTEKATSMGVEIDVRKQLIEFEAATGFLNELKNLTVIFNTSLIKSEIHTSQLFARDTVRIMQGQSPYIVNLGLNYQNPDNGLSVSISYNNIGKRIAYVGTPVNPHTWELPRNALDLTIQKQFGKRTTVKLGIKDILNDPVQFVQYYGENDNVQAPTNYYINNRLITLGVSIKL